VPPNPRIIHRREDVAARAQREFDLLDAAVARLRPEDWARPVPRPETRAPWTVKDALAHVTYWKEHHVRAMRRERQPPWGDVEARNRTVYALWRDRPPEDVVAYHRAVHADAMRAVAEAPDAWFTGRPRAPQWPADLVGHVAEHRGRDIERALGQPPPRA
jgi:uncharacterized protein (TIGR03083 family)